MDYASNNFSDRVGRSVGRRVKLVVCSAVRHWKLVIFAYICMTLTGALLARYTVDDGEVQDLHPRWGGFHERPMTNKCYRQERTAMLLNMILGPLGVDQFYAHHWALAVFKLFTLGGLGVWWVIDMILWIVGGVYGTPGCPGGSGGWRY